MATYWLKIAIFYPSLIRRPGRIIPIYTRFQNMGAAYA